MSDLRSQLAATRQALWRALEDLKKLVECYESESGSTEDDLRERIAGYEIVLANTEHDEPDTSMDPGSPLDAGPVETSAD